MKYSIWCFMFLLSCVFSTTNANAQIGQWSSYDTLNDGYKNGIQLSWKSPKENSLSAYTFARIYNRYNKKIMVNIEFTYQDFYTKKTKSSVLPFVVNANSLDQSLGNQIDGFPIYQLSWRVVKFYIEGPSGLLVEVYPNNELEAEEKRIAAKQQLEQQRKQQAERQKQQDASRNKSSGGTSSSGRSTSGSASGGTSSGGTSSGGTSSGGTSSGGTSSGGTSSGGASSGGASSGTTSAEQAEQIAAGAQVFGSILGAVVTDALGSKLRFSYGNFQPANSVSGGSAGKAIGSLSVDLTKNNLSYHYDYIGIGSTDMQVSSFGAKLNSGLNKPVSIGLGYGFAFLAKRGKINLSSTGAMNLSAGIDFKIGKKMNFGIDMIRMIAANSSDKKDAKAFDGTNIRFGFLF